MNKRYKLVATGLGLGYSPFAPGTVGSLGGCISALLIIRYTSIPEIILSLLILLFFFLGVISSSKAEEHWGKDPSRVVIDEVVGMWISMLMIPVGLWYALAAFAIFRLLDIYKPLKIREFEKMKSGWGIMMDDVIAGVYTNLIIQLAAVFIKTYK